MGAQTRNLWILAIKGIRMNVSGCVCVCVWVCVCVCEEAGGGGGGGGGGALVVS